MDEGRLRTIAQLNAFLAATPHVVFSAASADDSQRYGFIDRVLGRFGYTQLGKADRGVVLAYLRRASGYSRAQITRLLARWADNRQAAVPLAKRYRAPAAPFARKYMPEDVQLLVQMDRAHEDVCGPAIVHLLKRAHQMYGDVRYARLAGLSVSHLYNLRKSARYQTQRASFSKTRPVCNPIGVRKAPSPDGRAGFVRIDTVHQGDLDGVKGVYHITCVDQNCYSMSSITRKRYFSAIENGTVRTICITCSVWLAEPPRIMRAQWPSRASRRYFCTTALSVPIEGRVSPWCAAVGATCSKMTALVSRVTSSPLIPC